MFAIVSYILLAVILVIVLFGITTELLIKFRVYDTMFRALDNSVRIYENLSFWVSHTVYNQYYLECNNDISSENVECVEKIVKKYAPHISTYKFLVTSNKRKRFYYFCTLFKDNIADIVNETLVLPVDIVIGSQTLKEAVDISYSVMKDIKKFNHYILKYATFLRQPVTIVHSYDYFYANETLEE